MACAEMTLGLYSDEELRNFADYKDPDSVNTTNFYPKPNKSDLSRISNTLCGQHFDNDKPRTDLLPPKVLLEVADIFKYGASKYEERNWQKGIKFTKLYASCLRHLLRWGSKEDTDSESGQAHLAHLICDAMMLLDLRDRHPEMDDR